jgi:hypothetical protein
MQGIASGNRFGQASVPVCLLEQGSNARELCTTSLAENISASMCMMAPVILASPRAGFDDVSCVRHSSESLDGDRWVSHDS